MNTISIDESRLSDIKRFAETHERDIVRDIARLVRIPSVEGPAEPGAPFGIESRKALDCALQIAEELGLDTVNCENKIGYATIGTDHGQGYLATITHVDVVPAGDGWSADPFTLREREGYLIGRGVMDDKGPSVLCLYALKYLALIDAAYFVLAVVTNPFPFNLLPVVAVLNFVIFFAGTLLKILRRRPSRATINFRKASRKIRQEQREQLYHHKCSVCGRTDTEYPGLEFRYCSRCVGYHCFCIDHINNHIHFTE